MIEDDQDKAEAMENYFETVFSQELFLDEELDPNAKPHNRLHTVNFDRDDVLKAVSILYMGKSTEPEELHPKSVDFVYKDFRKVSDVVLKNRLLLELKNLGISGPPLK